MAENPQPVAIPIPEESKKPSPPPPSRKAPFPLLKSIQGIVSLVTLIFSLPILGSVAWLFIMKDYACEDLLRLPKFRIGITIALIFFFLVSNMVVSLRTKAPVIGFFLIMVLSVVMFVMGLALVGAYKMESRKIIATPVWFREKVRTDRDWEEIKSCIYGLRVCDDLAMRTMNLVSYDFSAKELSPIEAGCCKPPTICGMKYVNATFWIKDDESKQKEEASHDMDCDTWQNDKTTLCYDCISCKQGFVKLMESKWWKFGCFLVVMSVLLIVCHLLLFIVSMVGQSG